MNNVKTEEFWVDKQRNYSKAANGTEIPCEGWIQISFKLATSDHEFRTFLISTDAWDHPIVGYNVIEEIVKNSGSYSPSNHEEKLVNVLSLSLKNGKQEIVEALVNFIRTTSPS